MKGRAGFTLVEVLVAVVISGAVLAAAYGVVGTAADSRGRLEELRGRTMPGTAARAALERWLGAAALLEGGGPFVGTDRRSGPFSLDEVSFTVEDGGALYPGPRRVRIWVERSTVAPRTGLLAEVADLRPHGGERTDTLELAPAAGGISLRYRAVVQAREQWLDTWRSDIRLPDAVELVVLPSPERVTLREGDGLPDALRPALRVPLRTDENGDVADAAPVFP